jgi:ribosomal protein S18 acetylase RimI-like enzyme
MSTKLGMPYIKKSFEWFLTRDNCFLFHVVNAEGLVIGYCGGFIPRFVGDGSTSGIMQYTMKEAITGVILHPWLLFNKEVMAMYPLIFKNIQKKIFKKKQAKIQAAPVASVDRRAGLVVIGVHPEYRGTGVFQMLMNEFEKRALSFGLPKLVLSVKKDNGRAVHAYTKQGWFIFKEHPVTLEMVKYLQ